MLPVLPPQRIPREIWVLIAAAFVIAVGFGIITPVLPQFATSFGVGVAAASVVVSAFAFFRLIFAPAGGKLVDKLGERPVYLTGLLIVAVSTGATAFAQNYVQLVTFRALGGIGSTMFTVSVMALLVRLAPPAIRGKVSSAYATAFLLGSVGGPLIGGALGGYGLRVPFMVYAVALLIAAAVVAVFLPSASLRPPEGSVPKPPMTIREAWSHSAFRAVMASGFANGWSNIGVRIALIPLFVAAVISEDPWIAGAALAIYAVGNALALTVSGRLADTIGRKPLVLTGLVVGGLATLVLGFMTSLTWILATSFVAGMGSGTLNPGQQATIADVIGNDRSGGKVLATYSMAMDIGAIGGPVLAGLVADLWGFEGAFAMTGVILLLAAVAWAPAGETKPQHDDHPAPSATLDDELRPPPREELPGLPD